MSSAEKLKAVMGLANQPFSDILLKENHPLCKCWHVAHAQCNELETECLLTAHMGFYNVKHALAMHYPSLIQCSCSTNDASDFYPNAITGKKSKWMAC